jgi:predicted RNA-binding Zn-ribbon protein involved in translation (DUF1610 family)
MKGDETMEKLICPHCGKPGISVMQKVCLGPAWAATCKACGKKVGVPYKAMAMVALPAFAAILVSPFVHPFAFKVALWIYASVLAVALHTSRAPLVPR